VHGQLLIVDHPIIAVIIIFKPCSLFFTLPFIAPILLHSSKKGRNTLLQKIRFSIFIFAINMCITVAAIVCKIDQLRTTTSNAHAHTYFPQPKFQVHSQRHKQNVLSREI